MMDFQLSDDQKELQETARKFARSELMELSREMEEKAVPLP
ncbi:acyl-CoA dehydrogenase, partial [Sphingomonas koreensis]